MHIETSIFIPVYLVCAALALAGKEVAEREAKARGLKPVDAKLHALTAIFKPVTTTLLFAFLGWPQDRFQWFVAFGIFFSLVGDVALLSDKNAPFVVGLVNFLLAHVMYIVAFLHVGRPQMHVAIFGVIFAALAGLLVYTVWGYAGKMRIPVLIYATAITTMVVSASSTLGGELVWALPAVIGAVFFFIGDASLAIDKFRKPIPRSWLLTSGVYWLGQLGIVWAARSGIR